jgi:hypothetical protein
MFLDGRMNLLAILAATERPSRKKPEGIPFACNTRRRVSQEFGYPCEGTGSFPQEERSGNVTPDIEGILLGVP